MNRNPTPELADILDEWANRVRTVRIGTGLSQKCFARVLGVTLSTLSLWERGLVFPHSGTHSRVLKELKSIENECRKKARKN